MIGKKLFKLCLNAFDKNTFIGVENKIEYMRKNEKPSPIKILPSYLIFILFFSLIPGFLIGLLLSLLLTLNWTMLSIVSVPILAYFQFFLSWVLVEIHLSNKKLALFRFEPRLSAEVTERTESNSFEINLKNSGERPAYCMSLWGIIISKRTLSINEWGNYIQPQVIYSLEQGNKESLCTVKREFLEEHLKNLRDAIGMRIGYNNIFGKSIISAILIQKISGRYQAVVLFYPEIQRTGILLKAIDNISDYRQEKWLAKELEEMLI